MYSIYISFSMTSMEIVIDLKINLPSQIHFLYQTIFDFVNGPQNVAKKVQIQFFGLLEGNLSNDEILGLFSSTCVLILTKVSFTHIKQIIALQKFNIPISIDTSIKTHQFVCIRQN